MLDAALQYIKDNVAGMSVCTQQPATKAEADTTYALATVAVASGDITLADDTSGRKLTVTAKAAVSVTATGNGNHVALYSSTALLLVTTCTGIDLTNGGTVDFPAWKDNIQDAA